MPPPKFVFDDAPIEGRVSAIRLHRLPGCIVGRPRAPLGALPGCRVNSFAQVECVLFDNVVIGRHARVRRAILDKGVNIPEGAMVGWDLEADRKRFTVTESGIVVIAKGTNL